MCGCVRKYTVKAYDHASREVINEDFNDLDAAVRRAKSLSETAGEMVDSIRLYGTKVIESVNFISSFHPKFTLKKETTL